MVRGKGLFAAVGGGIVLGLVGLMAYTTGATDSRQPPPGVEGRADVITIDAMVAFGPLERPAVRFLHDKHVDALEKKGKDCQVCHMVDKDRQSPKFMRLRDENRDRTMNLYHDKCIECHKESSASGVAVGPVEACGECHGSTSKVVSSRSPMGFDRSLHYRHARAQEDKCDRCHHEYDKVAKKLFYEKDKEGTCRYCHGAVSEENRISMRLASHGSCIDCHQKRTAQAVAKKDTSLATGPVKCAGCHDAVKQKAIKKVADVPRMKRNQPDVALLLAEQKGAEQFAKAPKMDPVPFDHKAHEGYNDTCRVCHHASLESCAKYCHTYNGAKLGKEIKLERAMHQTGATQSCIGCHEVSVKRKDCAGCHAFSERDRSSSDLTMCVTCHTAPAKDGPANPAESAASLLKMRKSLTGTGLFREEDIPEKVLIRDLSDKYEPAELPHRKIIYTLAKNMKGNKLGEYFHGQEGKLCQGCHHRSPPSQKPPRCGSCHGKPFDERNPSLPGIKAAYHQQCMGCHREMGLKKPSDVACAECHKEKKS